MTNDIPTMEEPGPAEIPSASVQETQIEAKPAAGKPALTIAIQSWATPIVGIMMLVAGLLIGYFGRPVVSDRIAGLQPTVTSQPTPAVAAGPQARPQSREELMDYLISQTRHFRGNPEASVVMLEFSDFQ